MGNVRTDNVRRSYVQHRVHLNRLWSTHLLRMSYCAWVFLSNSNNRDQFESYISFTAAIIPSWVLISSCHVLLTFSNLSPLSKHHSIQTLTNTAAERLTNPSKLPPFSASLFHINVIKLKIQITSSVTTAIFYAVISQSQSHFDIITY